MNPRESFSQRARGMLFLLVNLVSLVLLSGIDFRRNEPYLLHGLDGTYMMTMVRQQAVWVPLQLGLTNNFFQSLGNLWFPVNMNLIPAYAMSRVLNHGQLDHVTSYVLFAVEIFLAAYLVSVWLGLGHGVAAVAAWGLALTALPYAGHAMIYGALGLIPQLSTMILATVVVVMVYRSVGRTGPWRSATCLVGVMLLLAYLAISQAVVFVLMVPAALIFCSGLILAAESRREMAVKLVGGVAVVGGLFVLGLPQFLWGIYRYTAVYVFQAELVNYRQTWVDVSMASNVPAWGWTGALLYAGAAGGGATLAMAGKGLPRVTAMAMLVTMGLLATFGVLRLYMDFWKGPTSLYFEFVLWPYYAAYAAALFGVIAKKAAAPAWALLSRRWGPWSVPAGRPRASAMCLLVLVVPGTILLVMADVRESYKERSYPYPPRLTPIVTELRSEIALTPGSQFRGRVATFTGERIQRPMDWFDLHALDRELLKRFGNDHRAVGLWYYDIPTLFEYSQFITAPFYLFTKTFLSRADDPQIRNVMVLRRVDPRALRMLGVRFFITDVRVDLDARLRVALDAEGGGLFLYELAGVNLGDFSPTHTIVAPTAGAALTAMSQAEFDPRHSVVVDSALEGPLVPASSARLFVDSGSFRVAAKSEGTSVLVLPLEYSRCLEIEAPRTSGARLFRGNLLGTGVLFHGELDATLTFFTGPLHNARCRIEDARDVDRLGIRHEVRARPSSASVPR